MLPRFPLSWIYNKVLNIICFKLIQNFKSSIKTISEHFPIKIVKFLSSFQGIPEQEYALCVPALILITFVWSILRIWRCAAYAQRSSTNEATAKSPPDNTISITNDIDITNKQHHQLPVVHCLASWPAFKVAQYGFWCHKLRPHTRTCSILSFSVSLSDSTQSDADLIRELHSGLRIGTIPIVPHPTVQCKWWKLPFNKLNYDRVLCWPVYTQDSTAQHKHLCTLWQ